MVCCKAWSNSLSAFGVAMYHLVAQPTQGLMEHVMGYDAVMDWGTRLSSSIWLKL
jgi:hypothetical protein